MNEKTCEILHIAKEIAKRQKELSKLLDKVLLLLVEEKSDE